MKLINKTSLLASAIGLTLASGMALAQAAGYLTLKEVEVEWEGKADKKMLEVEIKTGQDIPTDGKSGAFGYAILTDSGNNVLVLTTHLPIDDSSYEATPSGFHAHVLDLKKPTDACQGANFEVDLENSGKNTAFDANYKWKVDDNEISVKKVPVGDLGDAGVESVVSFTLKPILDANKKPTNLCVTVVDQA
ncbi:hypothetical protein [Methylobacter sp.]|jgi:hypothetical protein|uniref:hypothetical protein n=1 Tax=Methylobacter sp. TaxID=2051955 RepID=UPI003DA2CCDD